MSVLIDEKLQATVIGALGAGSLGVVGKFPDHVERAGSLDVAQFMGADGAGQRIIHTGTYNRLIRKKSNMSAFSESACHIPINLVRKTE